MLTKPTPSFDTLRFELAGGAGGRALLVSHHHSNLGDRDQQRFLVTLKQRKTMAGIQGDEVKN